MKKNSIIYFVSENGIRIRIDSKSDNRNLLMFKDIQIDHYRKWENK